MTENPFDGQVTRKVKHVYNSIDTLSIRLGVFLRRYPAARILIIIYMVSFVSRLNIRKLSIILSCNNLSIVLYILGYVTLLGNRRFANLHSRDAL